MKLIRYPSKEAWATLLKRPADENEQVRRTVQKIIRDVAAGGDRALRNLAMRYDKAEVNEFQVSEFEFARADERVPAQLKRSIKIARSNIEKFHEAQRNQDEIVETMPGVTCWRRSVPIEKVGLYVPGGTAPLFSTVLMLGVPARIAGCKEIVICTPPGPEGKIADAILYTAKLCGISKVFKVGGAQAIAALAFGTETIPRVYKIFGPGNRFVTAAKQILSNDIAIDMPAGPSEVAVVADDSCHPGFVAADLLSQAEHGHDSQVMLVSTSEKVIRDTLKELENQLSALPRRKIAEQSLANSIAILVRTIKEAIAFVNEYAPEHLILAIARADKIAGQITNAGSVFVGNYSCESAGDYASGTNHTLPTAGFARSFSGVSLESFIKKITYQRLTKDGLRNIGPAIEHMAAAEGLDAHKRAVSIRLEALNDV